MITCTFLLGLIMGALFGWFSAKYIAGYDGQQEYEVKAEKIRIYEPPSKHIPADQPATAEEINDVLWTIYSTCGLSQYEKSRVEAAARIVNKVNEIIEGLENDEGE